MPSAHSRLPEMVGGVLMATVSMMPGWLGSWWESVVRIWGWGGGCRARIRQVVTYPPSICVPRRAFMARGWKVNLMKLVHCSHLCFMLVGVRGFGGGDGSVKCVWLGVRKKR